MWIWGAVSSSLGKKLIMALTGLALCGFLATHLLGNLFFYAGQERLDAYAKLLTESSLLIPAEIFLFSLFAVHIALAIRTTIENRRSRPERYVVRSNRGAKTLPSSTMILTGVTTLVFVIVHVINFRLAGLTEEDSLYKLVVATFQNSMFYVCFYVAAVVLLGLHLSHGFQSALRTLGLRHQRFDRIVNWAGYGFAFVMAAGFCSIPIYLRFVLGETP